MVQLHPDALCAVYSISAAVWPWKRGIVHDGDGFTASAFQNSGNDIAQGVTAPDWVLLPVNLGSADIQPTAFGRG